MEIAKIYFKQLRNGEHQQLLSDIRSIAQDANPEESGFKLKFDVFDKCCTTEIEALKRVTRSSITPQIQEADHERDEMFRGLSGANLAATRHYTPVIREAATRLQIVFDTYGNIAKKAIAEQTAAVDGLVGELTMKHAADVETVGLKGWIDELTKRNAQVSSLMLERYNETASQNDLVLRDVRQASDDAYRSMIRRIEALHEVLSEDKPTAVPHYENLIRRINAVIGRANDILAARRGRNGETIDEAGA
jgi:hypothetical protein